MTTNTSRPSLIQRLHPAGRAPLRFFGRARVAIGWVLLCGLVVPAIAWCAPGDLDLTFGQRSGILTTGIGSGTATTSIAIDANGRLISFGWADGAIALLRYLPNGSIDTSFGTGGLVQTSISGASYVTGVDGLIDQNGRIVVLADANIGGSVFALVRYDGDGLLDQTFGSGGIVTAALGSSPRYPVAVALDSLGRIVVAGGTTSPADFLVARFNPSGALDPTFGTGGVVTTDVQNPSIDHVSDVAIDSQNRPIVVGSTLQFSCGFFGCSSSGGMAIVRYTTSGGLDSSFGVGGTVIPVGDNANAVAIAPGDRLVIAGTRTSGSQELIEMLRLDATGTLDPSFGSGGQVLTQIGTYRSIPVDTALDFNGRIVVTAQLLPASGPNGYFETLRYNANGSLDTSFGTGGAATTSFTPDFSDVPSTLAIDGSGRIVVGGQANYAGVTYVALARYDGSGIPDTTFGRASGTATHPVGSASTIFGTALQWDGKIVGAGFSDAGSGEDLTVVRLLPDGSLDPSFDGDGFSTIALAGGPDLARAVAVRLDGTIVAAGDAVLASEDFAVVRLLPSGAPDPTFGTGGKVTTDLTGDTDRAYAVVAQDDGKVIAFGFATNSGKFAAVRYKVDGTLDGDFGGDGIVTTPIGTADAGLAAALQSDGKLVGAGYATISGEVRFALVRYLTDGSLDPAFNGTGIVTTSIGGTTAEINSVAVQPDGKIVAAGYAVFGSFPRFAIARYLGNGALDPSFGSGGIVTITPLAFGDAAFAVAVEADGKILVSGHGNAGTAARDFTTIRLLSNGSIDASFGDNGRSTTVFGSDNDEITGMAIQPDGKIVAGGRAWFGGKPRIAFARYAGDSPSACGNGAREPGEQCDDANTQNGDCCSSACRIEAAGTVCRAGGACDVAETCSGTSPSCPADQFVASGTACTDDGDVCTLDSCDGAGACAHTITNDADGDEVCDAVDPCTNTGAQLFLSPPKSLVLLSKVNTDPTPGNDKFKLGATFDLPPGKTFADLQPDAHGARIVVETANGARPLDVTLATGLYDPIARVGWKRSGSGKAWTFLDRTASSNGIAKVGIVDKSSSTAPRRVKFQAIGKDGTYPLVETDAPVQAMVTLGNAADALAGLCGESSFDGIDCLFNGAKNQLVCKR